ncbi:hypothetical protein CRG98_029039 [Punica granatum]|uniref:Uncharacterized protein n=1 Tax=Punica granatum TaxID=22663 RepID=A0A2I0J497_PUNGR|nr:hypothetical protein CRG98_029039 [Punica granatum]
MAAHPGSRLGRTVKPASTGRVSAWMDLQVCEILWQTNVLNLSGCPWQPNGWPQLSGDNCQWIRIARCPAAHPNFYSTGNPMYYLFISHLQLWRTWWKIVPCWLPWCIILPDCPLQVCP